ncbi:MAG TPA: hypothetical protein VF203_13830 [Burkholderiales bacterium]
MRQKTTASFDAHDLASLHLTPDTFEPIYNTIVGLKFPVDVARVLELRYLINHAVDNYPEPAPTSDYREFRNALQAVIDATGIENKRHSERMLRILSMMRELHYEYSIKTRDAENELRAAMAANRLARRRTVRYALGFTLAAIASGIVWLAMPEPTPLVQLATLGFGSAVLVCVRRLPVLDRTLAGLEKRMNQLQRHRVKSIHWRTLVHKLALLLGYKRSSDVEVFLIDNDSYDYPTSRLHH